MDDEIRKDMEFARAVNDEIIAGQWQILAAANAEPYRQLIAEVFMLRNISAEDWFNSPVRQPWAQTIRKHRLMYEDAQLAESDKPAPEQDNEILAELKALRAELDEIKAAQQTDEPETETGEKPAPAEEDEPESDGNTEDKSEED